MTLASECIDVDPIAIVLNILDGQDPICERTVGGVSYHTAINGRTYTGRGNTQREAAWALLKAIAHRQQEIESCR